MIDRASTSASRDHRRRSRFSDGRDRRPSLDGWAANGRTIAQRRRCAAWPAGGSVPSRVGAGPGHDGLCFQGAASGSCTGHCALKVMDPGLFVDAAGDPRAVLGGGPGGGQPAPSACRHDPQSRQRRGLPLHRDGIRPGGRIRCANRWCARGRSSRGGPRRWPGRSCWRWAPPMMRGWFTATSSRPTSS